MHHLPVSASTRRRCCIARKQAYTRTERHTRFRLERKPPSGQAQINSPLATDRLRGSYNFKRPQKHTGDPKPNLTLVTPHPRTKTNWPFLHFTPGVSVQVQKNLCRLVTATAGTQTNPPPPTPPPCNPPWTPPRRSRPGRRPAAWSRRPRRWRSSPRHPPRRASPGWTPWGRCAPRSSRPSARRSPAVAHVPSVARQRTE